MAVPKYHELYGSFLRALQDGEIHTVKEIRESIAAELEMTNEDLEEMLPSGKQSLFSNRVGWAKTYLKKAGLIESSARARFALTEEGQKVLPIADQVDDKFLTRYASFREFTNETEMADQETNDKNEAERSPEEILETAHKQINATLASDLMDEVIKLSPTDFEKLVVKLLLKMGYGSGIDDAGIVTKASNDGGIDGIIKEDQLGFSSIYIQAKQWAVDRKVDRPEIQKFAGALQGEKASKGMFITTAQFSSGAKTYAENLHSSTIVLVDGNQLMKLMIRFDRVGNVGVSPGTAPW